jgi:hypothetical protein
MTDFVEILQKTLAEMKYFLEVKKVTDLQNGSYLLQICNSQYLHPLQIIELNSASYTVSEVDVNNEIIVIGSVLPVVGNYEIRTPLFITDTSTGANNELILQNQDLKRHPFIWLVEQFNTEIETENSLNISDSFVKILFLTYADNNDWLYSSHHRNCLLPMKNLAVNVIKEIERSFAGKIEKITFKNLPRFGVYKGDKGSEKLLLSEQLSGVELTAKIPIRKWAVSCKC